MRSCLFVYTQINTDSEPWYTDTSWNNDETMGMPDEMVLYSKNQTIRMCLLVLVFSVFVTAMSGLLVRTRQPRKLCFHNCLPVEVPWTGSQTRNLVPVNSYQIDVLPATAFDLKHI